MDEIKKCIVKAIMNCKDKNKLVIIYTFITNVLSK